MGLKKNLMVFCAAATLGMAVMTPATSTAATTATKDIAVLDLQKLREDALVFKSIREQIEKKRSTFKKEITADEEKLRKKDQELSEQRNLLSPEAFEQERNQFKEQVTSFQKEVQEMRVDLDQAYGKSLNEVHKAVTEILDGLSQERGYAMVLPAGQTLHFDNSMDITGEVITRLNKKLPNLNVESLEKSKDKE